MKAPRWLRSVRLSMEARFEGTAPLQTDDAGFTLIEALVSFVIFIVVAMSSGTAIVNAIKAGHQTEQRVAAADVAQAYIGEAIVSAEKTVPEEGRTIFASVGDAKDGNPEAEQFNVIRTVTFDAGDACSPGKLFTVNIEVHQAQTDKFLARSDARVACPPA